MDKRKAIVIAVVLFLLIGLGTFVFANPTQRGLEGDNTGNTTQGGSESVDDNTDGKEENANEEQDEENDEPVISVIDDGNNNTENGDGNSTTNNGGSTESDNSAYLAALAALEKAEESFLQGDLDAAKDLINDLEANADKDDLALRAEELQNVLDVEALVKNLQNKVNNAANIGHVNEARDYREDEEIVNKVTALENSSKKEELETILATVAKILDDKKAPSISGIEDGVVTSLDITLKVTDDNAVIVYVNGTETTFEDLQNMKFTEEKDYEVVVVDAAYNEAKLSFAKDVTAPEFNVNDGYKTKDNIDVVVTEAHLDRVEVTNETTGEKVTYTTNEFTLTNEGVYTLVAFDKANLTKEIKVEIDKSAPNGYDVGILNVTHYREENPNLGYAKVDDEIRVIVHFKEQLATLPTLSINGVSLENEFFYAEQSSNVTKNDYVYMADVKLDAEFIQKVSLVDGDIKFTISGYADAVGNVGEELTNDDILEDAKYNNVEFDTIAATMDYSTLYFEETGKVAYDVNGYKTYYMKNGDSVVFRIAFHEELNDVPTVTIGGQNVEMTSKGLSQNNDGEDIYVYEGTFKIAEDEATMTEGMLEIKLSNVVDLAGNVATDEAVLNQTPTSNNRVMIYDRTPIKASHFYFISTHEENRNVVGDGQYVIVEAAFDEEFTSVPRLKIGEGQYIDLDDCHWTTNWTTNKFVCRNSSVRLDNSLAKLENGQVIPVEITNIVDRAGNETVLTNNDVTFNDTYKELVFDSRAPEMFSLGITGFLAENDDAHYITYGKGFRVLLYVDEELATYPKLKFEGNDKEYVVSPAADNDPSINRYSYFLDVPASDVTKENFKEGEVKFEIYGYKDLAGNEGKSLTNDDINSDIYDKVIIDSTAPDAAYLSYRVDGDAADGVGTYYATNGDKLYISTAVSEELGANPIATFTDSEGKQFTSELEFTFINNIGQYIYTSYVEINPDLDVADGVLKVDVTNFKDKAGNKSEETFTSSKVVIDRTFVKEVHLYALNRDKENHKLIRDNENLYLELVFDEEIVTNPIVKVGDGSEVSMACSWRDESQGWPARLYKCDATITIDGKSMNLTTNQNIPITIKNIKDAAGNETVLTEANLTNNDIKGYGQVVYDMTPPVHATLGITGFANENYDTHYITYGKGFRVALYFNEELSEVPKVKFDNFDKEYTAVVGQDTDASKNIYSYIIDIPAGDVNAENFSEGEIKFQVYGYKDLAGNEGEVLDNEDINHPTQTKVVIDNTVSVDRWVYILNLNDSSYRTSISDGETLLVEATFNEPLQAMPTLEIGNSKFVFTIEEKLGIEDHYAYRVKVNINSSLGLEEGKEIPFKITNIVDLAGNKAESLDNNDVVYHQGKGYGQVVYENPIVSLTFHNATHYKENEDLGSNVSVTEASYGDTLRVFVRTSQDFDLAYKPIININGFTKELNLSNVYNDGTKDYGADIKITDEMNLTLGEEIPFTIENIVLENGNALPNLTNEDITSNTLSGVVLVEE